MSQRRVAVAILVVVTIITVDTLVAADHLYQVLLRMLEHQLVLGVQAQDIIVGIAD